MPIGQRRPRTIREALRKRQREVGALQQQIVTRELTPRQKKVAGKIPQAEVVSRIGTVGRRTAAGRSTFREPKLSKPVRLFLRVLGQKTERTAKISLRARNVPATVRHEISHQVLNLQDIPTAEHHPIIKKARVTAKKGGPGAVFRLLEPARTAIRHGATQQAAEPRLRRAKQRELRRRVRGGK